MSQKKGAKGMPSDGPGKHNPSKPVKSDNADSVFDNTMRNRRYEGPKKTRP